MRRIRRLRILLRNCGLLLIIGLRLVRAVAVVRKLRDRVIRSRLRIVAIRIVENTWPKVWISPTPYRPHPVHEDNMIVGMVMSVVEMIPPEWGMIGRAVHGTGRHMRPAGNRAK